MQIGFSKIKPPKNDKGVKPPTFKGNLPAVVKNSVPVKVGKAPKMPPPVTPPVLCVDCIFYDFAKRLPEGNSSCNHDKFLGQQAALVRADDSKCGIAGKFFKKVKDKWSKDRAAKLAAEHAARKEADKAAAKERKANPKGKKGGKWKKKFETKTFGKIGG